MKSLAKYIGAALVILGVIILVLLFINLSDYIQEFSYNPIYQYIMATDSESGFVKLAETEIYVSNNLMRIIALFFGLMFLHLWLKIGAALIKAGRSLIIDDMENVKSLLDSLLDEKEKR